MSEAASPPYVPARDRVAQSGPVLPLELRDVIVRAQGVALAGPLSLRLAGQGVTMVLGPSGAGKSLLLRLLHGLLAPASGQITAAGQAMGPDITRRQALVFQRPVLMRRSVAGNVDFVLRARGGADALRRDSLLELVGLQGRQTDPARRLSGGEAQRLALARALAVEPAMLLLDEPTASLDPASVHRIEQIVRGCASAGMRIVFVTHDLGQARRLADEVVFLHRGQVVEHAPATEFFEAPASEAAQTYLRGELLL